MLALQQQETAANSTHRTNKVTLSSKNQHSYFA